MQMTKDISKEIKWNDFLMQNMMKRISAIIIAKYSLIIKSNEEI